MNKKLISAEGRIVINKDLETVFDFFADPTNDHLWRKEINKSTVNGSVQAGAKIFEYSNLSKKASNNLIELICTRYEKNNIAVFETEDNAPFRLCSKRSVRSISTSATEIIYAIDFDAAIVKFALGFSLPKFIITAKAKADMKKYLQQLKKKM